MLLIKKRHIRKKASSWSRRNDCEKPGSQHASDQSTWSQKTEQPAHCWSRARSHEKPSSQHAADLKETVARNWAASTLLLGEVGGRTGSQHAATWGSNWRETASASMLLFEKVIKEKLSAPACCYLKKQLEKNQAVSTLLIKVGGCQKPSKTKQLVRCWLRRGCYKKLSSQHAIDQGEMITRNWQPVYCYLREWRGKTGS